VSRLVYKGLMAYVSERRHPNTANPKGLVRRKYVAGEDCQTSGNRSGKVSNNGYQCLQSYRMLTTASDVTRLVTWRGYPNWTLLSSAKVCHDLFYLANHLPECNIPHLNPFPHILSSIGSPNGSTDMSHSPMPQGQGHPRRTVAI
jgi:hypothetical protein